jgi:hypothetical protein
MLYKLTDRDGCTYDKTQWGPGVTHTADGLGPMCSPHRIHYYTDQYLAVLINPAQGNYANPRLFEAVDNDSKNTITDGTKSGTTSLTTSVECPVPSVTTEQYVTFGILCALEVYHGGAFRLWAEAWLTGADRSAAAAHDAAASYATYAAAYLSCLYKDPSAASYAAYAAAAYAARDATVYAAHDAAAAAAYAAAAYAAHIAAEGQSIDFVAIAHKAMGIH